MWILKKVTGLFKRIFSAISDSADSTVKVTFKICLCAIMIVTTMMIVKAIYTTDFSWNSLTSNFSIRTPPRAEIINKPDLIDQYIDSGEQDVVNAQTSDRIGQPEVKVEFPADSELTESEFILMIDSKLRQKRGGMIRDTRRSAGMISESRSREIDRIFERVYSEIPGFVDRHYTKRHQQHTMIELMSRQLLRQEELDLFIINTALEIDRVLFEIVEQNLGEVLAMIDLNTDTSHELKQRLPTAREICESIYRSLEKNSLNSQSRIEVANFYERLAANHPGKMTISKVAFVVLVAKFFPPAWPKVAAVMSAGILFNAHVSSQKDNYRMELANEFRQRHLTYNELAEKAIKDILHIYIDSITSGAVVSIAYSEIRL